MTYRFIEDPGHAWLEVPMTELAKLNLLGQISSFSYIRGNMAYLEEDCDAGVFIKAAGLSTNNIQLEYQDPCPIRDYPRFTGPTMRAAL